MVELHRLERQLLHALKAGEKVTVEAISKRVNLPEASVHRASLWLSSKGYAKVDVVRLSFIELGSEGKRFLEKGLPERVLVEVIMREGGRILLNEALTVLKMEKEEFSVALGWARKKRWIRLCREGDNTILIVEKVPRKGSDEMLIDHLSLRSIAVDTLRPELTQGLQTLRRRPDVLVEMENVNRFIQLTEQGLNVAKQVSSVEEEVSQLTPELIKSGKWRDVKLRKYDIRAPVGQISIGKRQPYLRFLDDLKWKLVSLGFKEMKGPIIESTFFNCDALYMPQDHPAREIHDIYYVKSPSVGDLSSYLPIVENVKATHENGWLTNSKGWGYTFSFNETRRLVLRSQGTSLSVRMLLNKKLEIPGKYFSIARCYRPDIVDKTHLTEFNHVEGIVLGEDLTFRDLLGILNMFALETAGADRVKFRPDYFPFTEPSVELSAYKDGFGWIEFGGAGMFRPEVTLPLGIKVPVIAWGLGVDRIFMMKAGISDIRDLFSQSLKWLREQKVV